MNPVFNYQDNRLFCESVSLEDCAYQHETPLYVYSQRAICDRFSAYKEALTEHAHLICYAVKANSNLAILELLASLGSGFDIVSGGELKRVLAAGGDPKKVVFSGVGKSRGEMRDALAAEILCFNIESAAELQRLAQIASEMGVVAPISVRVNPDVDAKTHPYISTGLKENKFGVDGDEAIALYQQAAQSPWIKPVGIDCHIGSQITEVAPFIAALEHLLMIIDRLADMGVEIDHLDIGGGLGVSYQNEAVPSISDYIAALSSRLAIRELTLILEPGRSVVAEAGVLLTRVEFLKPTGDRDFAIVDAAMNDMLRPSLYDAWLEILPVDCHGGTPGRWDIVGPVCETGDFLGKARDLDLTEGDLLAVMGAGAYGFSMASNYNTRRRPAEVIIDSEQVHLIREREPIESLWAGEKLRGSSNDEA